MARKAKDLVKNQRIFSNPNPKHSRWLPSTNVNFVKNFCEFDYISVLCLVKDFSFVRQGDQQVYVQK